MLDTSFVLITCAYNAGDYIDECIRSCNIQGPDVGHILIDDCSTDDTYERMQKYPAKNRVVVRTNKRTRTPGFLQQKVTREIIKNPNAIVAVVDGDDKLLPDAVKVVREQMQDNWMFCSNYSIGKNEYYKVRKSKLPDFSTNIRDQRYTFDHFRGWRKHLSDGVNPKDFFTKENKLMGAGSDVPYMYAMLEMAGKNRVIHIDDVLYHYNIYNPINDHKVNYKEQHDAVINTKGIDPYDTI
jgi:glycosyltransferase involved in cell wall biosynthesis